ncbi:MAG TPA: hypothetical protein VGE29_08515 [Prosthecobacter sp.]
MLDGSPCHGPRQKQDDLLLCASGPAEAQGAHTGMRASQALARCPRLAFVHRNEEAEKQLQDLLLQCAEAWTADYESTHPGVCLLDLSRVHRMHRSCWLEQGHLMRQDLQERGCEICVGLAETADLALLASHAAFPVRVIHDSMAEEKAAFDELPLSVLFPPAGLQETLHLWGIGTLGEFRSLKRQAVGERLGAAGLALWDLAHGGRDRLLKLVRPNVLYQQKEELENGIETLGPLLHLLRQFCHRLCSQLSLVWKVAAHLHLHLHFDDGTSCQKSLRIAEPTRDVELLLRILETHLESVTASAPVTQVSLEITPADPAAAQDMLFERGLRDPGKFAETLSALEALLGSGRVGRGQKLPSHQPDVFAVAPFLESPASSGEESAGEAHGLPLQRFRPPQQVEVMFQDACLVWLRNGKHTLHLTSSQGPWLLSGHWWDARHAWEQEVWDVAVQGGGLYRLMHERGTWKLEGRYG